MPLQTQLDSIKENLYANIPPEAVQVIEQAKNTLAASSIMENVLKREQKAPNFTLIDQNQNSVSLQELYQQGPLIIVFYRGVWWPYCNAELEALQTVYQDILDAGAHLVAISPQKGEYSKEMAEKHGITFPVLSDPGNKVAADFGLQLVLPQEIQELFQKFGIDLEKFNSDASWSLPLTGHFIVDSNGIIRDVAVSTDYTTRQEPAELLNILSHI